MNRDQLINKIERSFDGVTLSVLSFMDDDGLKFALPAYMRFAAKYYDASASASIDSVIYTLSNQRNWEFLSNKQQETIADFLSFMVLEADSHVDSWQASLAYENIWHNINRT
ncbi:MAG: hypothetical protein GY801_46180 [bacterium]|nr:hypothetical protein [bacterium]